MPYQHLPDNPPTTLSEQDYYVHRQMIYQRMNSVIVVPKPTGNAVSDTANIQDAINAAVTSRRGKTVLLSSGDYVVNATIKIRDVAGLRILGQGAQTRLIWSGATDVPVIKLAHARLCTLSDFYIDANGALAGIQTLRDNAQGSILSPHKNRFIRVESWDAQYGFLVGGDDAVDANNDFMLFEDCAAGNYSDSGWYITHSQSYNNVMRECFAWGTGISYGVRTGTAGGQFRWYGGGMNDNAVDFRIYRHYQPFVIDGYTGEQSGRILHMGSANYGHCVIRNVRWAANNINADLKAIVCEGFVNNILIEDCMIGDGQSPNAATTLDFGNHADTKASVIRTNIISVAESVWSGKTPQVIQQSWKVAEIGNVWTAL